MSVIVDTPVWSQLFRRAPPNSEAISALRMAIEAGDAVLLGPIRQEILSGVKESGQFSKLQTALRAFPDFPLQAADYELAATFYNRCRSKGIQGSNTDFLICAVAVRSSAEILTLDQDFHLYSQVLQIKLAQV